MTPARILGHSVTAGDDPVGVEVASLNEGATNVAATTASKVAPLATAAQPSELDATAAAAARPPPLLPIVIRAVDITGNGILLGRGSNTRAYEGNVRFRALIVRRQEEYATARPRQKKDEIAREILEVLREERRARFLFKVKDESVLEILGNEDDDDDHSMGGVWMEKDEDAVIEKIKQALRRREPPKASKSRPHGDHDSSLAIEPRERNEELASLLLTSTGSLYEASTSPDIPAPTVTTAAFSQPTPPPLLEGAVVLEPCAHPVATTMASAATAASRLALLQGRSDLASIGSTSHGDWSSLPLLASSFVKPSLLQQAGLATLSPPSFYPLPAIPGTRLPSPLASAVFALGNPLVGTAAATGVVASLLPLQVEFQRQWSQQAVQNQHALLLQSQLPNYTTLQLMQLLPQQALGMQPAFGIQPANLPLSLEAMMPISGGITHPQPLVPLPPLTAASAAAATAGLPAPLYSSSALLALLQALHIGPGPLLNAADSAKMASGNSALASLSAPSVATNPLLLATGPNNSGASVMDGNRSSLYGTSHSQENNDHRAEADDGSVADDINPERASDSPATCTVSTERRTNRNNHQSRRLTPRGAAFESATRRTDSGTLKKRRREHS